MNCRKGQKLVGQQPVRLVILSCEISLREHVFGVQTHPSCLGDGVQTTEIKFSLGQGFAGTTKEGEMDKGVEGVIVLMKMGHDIYVD